MKCKRPTHKRSNRARRSGVALIAFVTAMLVIGTLALWTLQLTATGNTSALGHLLSTGALYAAESGLEMAAREIGTGTDYDNEGSGTLGTISDNSNAADDLSLSTGVFYVEQVSASPATYRATGRPNQTTAPWSDFRRVIEFRTQ